MPHLPSSPTAASISGLERCHPASFRRHLGVVGLVLALAFGSYVAWSRCPQLLGPMQPVSAPYKAPNSRLLAPSCSMRGAACAGALRCEYGELPGRWTGNPPVWQPVDASCHLQDHLQLLLAKAAEPVDPSSPSSSKLHILVFGDSVDRMTVNDTCLATSTVPEPVDPVGQHEDKYLLMCQTSSIVMGVQSMIGVQPQGPYRWNLTGTPRDRIHHVNIRSPPLLHS